jgi:hypothetical protein
MKNMLNVSFTRYGNGVVQLSHIDTIVLCEQAKVFNWRFSLMLDLKTFSEDVIDLLGSGFVLACNGNIINLS